jgi:hypothetical protein
VALRWRGERREGKMCVIYGFECVVEGVRRECKGRVVIARGLATR